MVSESLLMFLCVPKLCSTLWWTFGAMGGKEQEPLCVLAERQLRSCSFKAESCVSQSFQNWDVNFGAMLWTSQLDATMAQGLRTRV